MVLKVIKRKTVAKSAANPFGRKVATSKKARELNETEPEVLEEEAEEENYEEEEAEEETQEPPEEVIKREEEEIYSARKKELKGMYIDDLKKTVTGYGIDLAKKEIMIESVLAHEAKQRADKREYEAQVREVVVKKKTELERLSAPDLKKLCDAADIKGQISKKDRVEKLLAQWLADGGVDKAFAQMAYEGRRAELNALEKPALRKLCESAGVDPFLKEVMIDRIVKHEVAAGHFHRPTLPSEQEATSTSVKKGDLVDNLLAEESDRKKQLEKQKQRDAEILSLTKELKSMSLEQLKKELSKRKLDATGKKEELIVLLYQAREQEAALVARTSGLKALSKDELKDLVTKRGLIPSRSKDEMVEAVLGHEQRLRSEVKEYESKVQEALTKFKENLRSKSASELKEMCVNKGVKPGVSLEERVERLGEKSKADGDIDSIASSMAREARKEALAATDKVELTKMCDKDGLDALIHDVMVERIMEYEDEHGRIEAPPAKKARK